MQGLEVVCVSDDDPDEAKWRTAVKKDDIGMFHHVLRGLKFDGKDFDRSEISASCMEFTLYRRKF